MGKGERGLQTLKISLNVQEMLISRSKIGAGGAAEQIIHSNHQ